MTHTARFLVPGENLHPLFATALSAVGIASAASALGALRVELNRSVDGSRVEPVASAVASPPPAAPPSATSSVTLPDAAAPVASSAGKCPALILNFRSESIYPSHAANPPLASLAKWLLDHPTASVFVDGHADATGSDDTNLRLSRQRAAFVGATLAGAGVPKSRMTVRGFGSYWPVDETPPDASWNRRVVVQTKGGSCPREKEEVIEP
ncbi:MAG TPA: OmpA family protein [Polyangiaceae bacterium]|nr:OmpA family protein [Polyangiaceae bacterium]